MARKPNREQMEVAIQMQLFFWKHFGGDEWEFDLSSDEGKKGLKTYLSMLRFGCNWESQLKDEETPYDLVWNSLSDEHKQLIEDLQGLIQREAGPRLKVGVIIISRLLNKDILINPVFRVSSDKVQYKFIDWHLRVYMSWEHYLDTNQMEKCFFLHPKGGVYKGSPQPHLRLLRSRSAKMTSAALSGLDNAAAVGIGLTTLAALPFGSVVIMSSGMTSVASGFWLGGRSAYRLYDRYNHAQTLNPLKDMDALNSWVGLILSIGVVYSNIELINGTYEAFQAGALETNCSIEHLIQSLPTVGNLYTKLGDMFKNGEMKQGDLNQMMVFNFFATRCLISSISVRLLSCGVKEYLSAPGASQKAVAKDLGGLLNKDANVEGLLASMFSHQLGVELYRICDAIKRSDFQGLLEHCIPFIKNYIWNQIEKRFSKLPENIRKKALHILKTLLEDYMNLRVLIRNSDWLEAVKVFNKALEAVLEFAKEIYIELYPDYEALKQKACSEGGCGGELESRTFLLYVPPGGPPLSSSHVVMEFSRKLFDDPSMVSSALRDGDCKIGGFQAEATAYSSSRGAHLIDVTLKPTSV